MSKATEFQNNRPYLNVFCLRHGDVFHVHAELHLLPPYLRSCFDEYGETAAVCLDMEDLERHMAERGAVFEKQVSVHGSVELTAHDDSAAALGEWLATAFASGVRGGNASPAGRVVG